MIKLSELRAAIEEMRADQLAALARAGVSVTLGGALLYAIGRYLGWYVAGAIVVAAVGYFAWTVVRVMSQLPTIWRLW